MQRLTWKREEGKCWNCLCYIVVLAESCTSVEQPSGRDDLSQFACE